MKAIKLKNKKVFYIYPTSPYNFDANVHKPSHFPSSDNLWEKGKYWISMVWQDKLLGLKLVNQGTTTKPKIQIYIFSQKQLSKDFINSLLPEIKHRFNTEIDISVFIKNFQKDKLLAPFIRKWKGMKPVAANSLYETLIIYLVLQNATIRRTQQMLENLFNRFGKTIRFNGRELSTFWKPEAITRVPEDTLRKLKLGYRAKFLKRVSEQFAKGEIDEYKLRKLPKEEVKKEALKLYGVGKASVEYLLFEDFYYYDALATIPPWEQKILSKLLYNKKLVSPNKILADAKRRWGEWRKLAIHYIWEDIFWKRKDKHINWLEKEIRL